MLSILCMSKLYIIASISVTFSSNVLVVSNEARDISSGLLSVWNYLPADVGVVECTEECDSSDNIWSWWWYDDPSSCKTTCVIAIIDKNKTSHRTLMSAHEKVSLVTPSPPSLLNSTDQFSTNNYSDE